MKFNLNEKENEISFPFQPRTYHKESVYGASLVFTNRAYVYIEGRGPSLLVTLRGKAPLDRKGLESLAGEFHNELLSQTLRWMVAKHNHKIKEAIQLQALYSAHAPVKAKK